MKGKGVEAMKNCRTKSKMHVLQYLRKGLHKERELVAVGIKEFFKEKERKKTKRNCIKLLVK